MATGRRDEPSTVYRWYVVLLLLLVSIFAYIDRVVFALLIDPLKTDLRISDTQAGALVGLAFTISYAFAGLAFGRIVDKSRRNVVLGVALAGWSLFTMLSGFTAGVASLFLARCGVGIGESAVNPASIAIISSSFPRERVSYGLSVFAIGIYGGGGLAIVLGGQLAAYLTSLGPISVFGSHIAVWRLVFVCVGAPGMLLAPVVWLTVQDQRSTPKPGIQGTAHLRSATSLRAVFTYARNQGSLYPLLFGGLIAFSFYSYAVQGWLPAMLSRTYGLTPREISIYYGIPYLVCGVAGALIAGATIRWFDSRHRRDSTVLVCQWTTILAFVPAILGPLSHSPEVAIACVVTVIFLAAIQHSTAFTTYVLVTPEGMRGQVIAAHVMALNVFSGTLGGIVVGLLSDHVFGGARLGRGLSVVAAIGMPTAALLFSLLRPVYRAAIADQLALSELTVPSEQM